MFKFKDDMSRLRSIFRIGLRPQSARKQSKRSIDAGWTGVVVASVGVVATCFVGYIFGPDDAKNNINNIMVSYINKIHITLKTSRYYFLLAIEEERGGNHDKAITLLDEAIKKDPIFSNAIVMEAIIKLNLRRFDEAKALLDAAAGINGKDNNVRIIALLNKLLIDYFAENYDEVISVGGESLIDRNINIDKHLRSTIHILIAEAFLAKKDYDVAIKNLILSISYNDESFLAYLDLGSAYELRSAEGDLALSLDNFNAAIARYPALSIAYQNRGHLYVRLKKYDVALKDYITAANLDKEFINPAISAGMFYADSKLDVYNLDEAIKYFSDGLKRNYTMPPSSYDIAGLYRITADELKKQTAYCRGNLYIIKNEYSLAESDFKSAMNSSLGKPERTYALGLSYIGQHKWNDAIETFNKLLAMDGEGENVYGRYYLSIAERNIGDFGNADKDWRLASRIPRYHLNKKEVHIFVEMGDCTISGVDF